MKYSPKRAYPVFALGSVYHAMAIEEKNMEHLDLAEENYNKALKLDPDFKECKEELDKLQDNKGKIGNK
jgi:tetratricopeptide (TPR) repeat protein